MAMSGSRTLTLKLLADIDNFKNNLNKADTEVSGFSGGLQKFSKMASAAFIAAGAAAAAYAGKLAIDGVKAAIEDEAAQLKLATTLQNVTRATDEQIKATEDYITKTSLAYGVTDDDLRPSLDRLVRSTKDVTEAQKLQTLALNISAGTGKSLTAVSEALAKAHDGNFASLKRLGVTIDDSIIKNKDFDAATKILADTFKDQASIQADTFDGKMRRLSVAFQEGKESLGGFILDAIQPLVNILVTKVIPYLANFSNGISNGLQPVIKIFKPILDGLISAFNSIKDALEANQEKLEPFYNLIQNIAEFVSGTLAPIIGKLAGTYFKILGQEIATIISLFANLVSFLTNVYNKIKSIIDFLKNNPISKFLGSTFSGASYTQANFTSETGQIDYGAITRSSGGGMTATPAQQARMVELAAETSRLRQETATIREKIAARASGQIFGSGTTINLNVNGAIDSEGTARTIVSTLNNSFYRGTGGADGLVYA